MIKASLILLLAICVAIIAAWFARPASRQVIEGLSSVFSLVASIVALTVFIQFYQTYCQAADDAAEKKREARAQFISRMTALSSEILSNILTCNLFDGEKDDYLAGKTAPGIRFRYDVAADMIRTGEITHHKLRSELMSLISQMESLNTVIEQSIQLMIQKSLADPARQDGVRATISHLMKHLLSKTLTIRTQLANTQPLLEEFTRAPEQYSDEKYLRDRLIPDALIR